MRNTLQTIFLAALFFAAGCSRYDRELMGDPEPEPSQQAPPPVVAQEAPEAVPADADSMDVGMFDELDFYGQWHRLDPYGWVWRPTVVREWQPFLNGHWIWSQYGWMWVDYDAWGWATSHYGYWTTDFMLGWVWIPDYQWSPVQCDWLIYDDWVCWSPVPPPGSRFKEPWEGDKAWVAVPVRKFKETNLAGYRQTPKFKAGSSEETMSRGAPDMRKIDQYGPKISRIEVQLDRRVVRDREFAKVKFPPDVERGISEHRGVPISGGSTSPRTNPGAPPQTVNTPYPPAGNDGGDGTLTGPPRPQPEAKAKSKDSGSKGKDSGGKTETKYKDKKSDEKKDDGKTKDDSKTTKKGKG